jgi:hypothetical protein
MAERGKGFPRISLASAIQIIDAASKFGKSWKKEQFASFGAKNNAGSAKSGAFAARLSALRDYGLVFSDKDNVTLTELAVSIVKPLTTDERESSIRKAFLSVGAFADLYSSFDKSQSLPRDKVAEHAHFNLGISRDSKDKFLNIFVDSGAYVGLVNYDKEAKAITLMPDGGSVDAEETSRVMGGPTVNEEGKNLAGKGWSLTVLFKTTRRTSPEVRKKVRDLLEKADELADELYESDKHEVGED